MGYSDRLLVSSDPELQMPMTRCEHSREDRLAREAAFHDRAFSEKARAAAAGFYSVTSLSKRCYFAAIDRCVRSGQRALEYGCGPGGYGIELARRRIRVEAIDVSPAGIEMGRKAAAERDVADWIEFHVMNAEALQFPDAYFDVVFGSGILHHLDLKVALAEIRRVLKVDGRAFFFEPLGHNVLINLYRKLTPTMRSADEQPLLWPELNALSGSFSVEVTFFHLLSLIAVPFRNVTGFSSLLRLLNGIDQKLFELIPATRRQAWIAVVELSRAPSDSQSQL